MANRHLHNGQTISELTRITRELEFTNQSIQFTADEQRRLHEEELDAAFRKHEEVRISAEREGERVKRDLAQEQRIKDHQEGLKADQARKEAAEQSWRLEEQRRQAIQAALAHEQAAERLREANQLDQEQAAELQRQTRIAAQEKLNAAWTETPQPAPIQTPFPLQQPVVQPIAKTAASWSKSEPVLTTRPEPEQVITRSEATRKLNGTNGIVLSSPFTGATLPQRSSTSTYLGLPLPETLPPELQRQYLEYIEILMHLKEHRQIFKEQILPDPQYRQSKTQVGDDRRFIRKSVSQLTEDRKKNKEIMDAVMDKLNKSLQSPYPKVSLSRFIPATQDSAPEVSSLYIYLVNIFTKAIFAQFLVDASSDSKKADAIGMFASQILATLQVQWQNQISLWPFLLAKFARRCPVLFGVYGDEKTTEGKILLGWGKEDGKFVTAQRHAERMTGLSSGWASITLRDYSKSKLENPAPSWYFWRSIALVLNIPPNRITNTHYIVLKGLIEHNEQRIMKLFGDYGKMVLQRAVLNYASNQYTGQTVAAQGLRLLKDVWEKDLHLVFVR